MEIKMKKGFSLSHSVRCLILPAALFSAAMLLLISQEKKIDKKKISKKNLCFKSDVGKKKKPYIDPNVHSEFYQIFIYYFKFPYL